MVKVPYKDIEIHTWPRVYSYKTAVTHSPLILSISLLYYFFLTKKHRKVEEKSLAWFQLAISSPDASFHDSRWLLHAVLQACCSLAACKETQQRTWCFITLLYLSGWCAVWCAELLNCEAPGALRIKKDWRYMNRPARPVCRWTAQGLCGLLRELMSNESDFRGWSGLWNMYRDVFQLESNCLWNAFLMWLMDWFGLPHEEKPHPPDVPCEKSTKSNQNDNNQGFQFAVLFHQIRQCVFYLLHSQWALWRAGTATVFQFWCICFANSESSPGDANKEMEST